MDEEAQDFQPKLIETEKTFSQKKAFSIGEKAFKKNANIFILITLAWLFIGYWIDVGLGDNPHFVVGIVAMYFIDTFVLFGLARIGLDAVDGKEATFSRFFGEWKKIWKVIWASVLYYLAILGGLILLIVPGFYVWVKYGYFIYFILEKDMTVKESFNASANLVKGHKWNVFWFFVLGFLLIIAGLAAFYIGLVVAIPIITIASAYTYRFLEKKQQI